MAVTAQDPKLERKSRLTATLRFFITISLALGISALIGDQQIGGFAALGAFMALLSDTESTLKSRLGGLLLTFLGVLAAAGVGLALKHLAFGEWLILAAACFGQSLMTFAEKFWWLWGKYVLVFLLISVFDFSPNLAAFIGYAMGFSLAALVVVADHYVWLIEKLGPRLFDQLRMVEGGTRNTTAYGLISALTMVTGLWLSTFIDMSEPGWVGITIIYILNSDVRSGFIRILLRILGTVAGYFAVVLLMPHIPNLYVLGTVVVLASLGIPYFVGRNYALMQFFITMYILFVLDWLMYAYGGDHSILIWRIWDTLLGAGCASVGLFIYWLWTKRHSNTGISK